MIANARAKHVSMCFLHVVIVRFNALFNFGINTLSNMKKKIRVWKKQEKRIVTLLYRKGLIKTDLKELYWETYKRMELNQRFYLPEIHFYIHDYFGEDDEFGLVDRSLECLYWEHAEETAEDCDGIYPNSTFKCKGRVWLIRYLKNLPTVRNDNKINKVLTTYEV